MTMNFRYLHKNAITDIAKWRQCYAGGRRFIETYLKKFSRETDDDFELRKSITYCPGFAAAAIDEIKDSIIHRLLDVTRTDGPNNYRKAVRGEVGGVDYCGKNMNFYIAEDILPDLLVVSGVGVLVDNFADIGPTQADTTGKHPYVKTIPMEDVISWAPYVPTDGYDRLYIRMRDLSVNEYGFPDEEKVTYRLYEKIGNKVAVTIHDDKEQPIGTFLLDVPQIPFVYADLGQSLMEKVADHQIAMLNIESSDLGFIMQSNFPFYYEFFNPRNTPTKFKAAALAKDADTPEPDLTVVDQTVLVGYGKGRKFPIGSEKPGYVAPDPKTLEASLMKQERLEKQIRTLVHLSLSATTVRRQSEESKLLDDRPLEAGLARIGQILQHTETKIVEYWSYFETGSVALISYPQSYDLKSYTDRIAEAKELDALCPTVPSDEFRRVVKKLIAKRVVGSYCDSEQTKKIEDEIDKAQVVTSDPNLIFAGVTNGLIGDEVAAMAIFGLGPEAVAAARKDRAEKIALVLAAQGGPENANAQRGAPEFGDGKKESKGEGRGPEDKTNFSGTKGSK